MFPTIRQAAKKPDCPLSEYQLRLRVAQGRCPGVYSGNRFLVDFEGLKELIRQEATASVREAGK